MSGQPVLLTAGMGDSISLRGTEVTFKVPSERADGASLSEWAAAPGLDTGLHVHERLEETWYVLDGELEFRVGEETFRAGPGMCVFVPPPRPARVRQPHRRAGEVPADLFAPRSRPLLRRARGDPCSERTARQRRDRSS